MKLGHFQKDFQERTNNCEKDHNSLKITLLIYYCNISIIYIALIIFINYIMYTFSLSLLT